MRKNMDCMFAVRLREDGTPWVVLQPKHEDSGGIEGEIGLGLYRGTSLNEAKQLARFLNSNIKAISFDYQAAPPQRLA